MPPAAVLGAQLKVLTRLGVDRLDLLQARAQHVDLPGPVAGQPPQAAHLRGHPVVVVVATGVVGQGGLHRGSGEAVEHHPVLLRLAQSPLVGLAVHGHEHLAELAEHADRCGAPADVGLERPSADTVRARISPSATSPPASAARAAAGWVSSTSTVPSTTALRAPVRTSAASARAPSNRPSPDTTIVLPAPVSP